jgi:hypothetical protein
MNLQHRRGKIFSGTGTRVEVSAHFLHAVTSTRYAA